MMPTEQWVTNKIEALEARIGLLAKFIDVQEQAHAELAAKVDALLARYDAHVLVHALDELESPAPAPDPVCQCGFPYDGKCMRRDCPGVGSECANCGHQLVDGSCVNCSYVPAEQPALDPGFRIAIREAVVRMAALNVTVQEVDDITDAVIHTMRTYGRDGAR